MNTCPRLDVALEKKEPDLFRRTRSSDDEPVSLLLRFGGQGRGTMRNEKGGEWQRCHEEVLYRM